MFEGIFQPMHLLVILGIALLIFGPKRLPELGKGLGTSIRDFKDAMSGSKHEEKPNSQLEAPRQAVQPPPPAQAAYVTPAAPPAAPAAAPPPAPPGTDTKA
jgi:sec-independent protein translocase protein TatA